MEWNRQNNNGEDQRPRISATFKVGSIALAFLIIGYEAALFVHRASVLRIQERRDTPDTVFVNSDGYVNYGGDGGADGDGYFGGDGGAGTAGVVAGNRASRAGRADGAATAGNRSGRTNGFSADGTGWVDRADGVVAGNRPGRTNGFSADGTGWVDRADGVVAGNRASRAGRADGAATAGNRSGRTNGISADGTGWVDGAAGAATAGNRDAATAGTIVRKSGKHPPAVAAVLRNTRRVENFRFNPNTVSVDDLIRLGFSEKQASSIDNYRAKGGRFRRKSDFARSFVVADSVYRRLEPYIDIPLLDINRADSAAFDALPGIGAWTAAKMVSYRAELGGYSCCEQLMDIYRFDRNRYNAIADLITCGPGATPFDLWGSGIEELRRHPCIRSWSKARSIVLYRQNNPTTNWTVEGLRSAGILDSLDAVRLGRCQFAPISEGDGDVAAAH